MTLLPNQNLHKGKEQNPSSSSATNSLQNSEQGICLGAILK